MVTKERVEAVLDRVRPFMQADGGDIELLEISGNSASVKLTGMCAGCPSAHMTLHVGVETVLRDEIPEFETLHVEPDHLGAEGRQRQQVPHRDTAADQTLDPWRPYRPCGLTKVGNAENEETRS
jgi:Fe-S cluster biogenesis protein NfuA